MNKKVSKPTREKKKMSAFLAYSGLNYESSPFFIRALILLEVSYVLLMSTVILLLILSLGYDLPPDIVLPP